MSSGPYIIGLKMGPMKHERLGDHELTVDRLTQILRARRRKEKEKKQQRDRACVSGPLTVVGSRKYGGDELSA